MNTKTSNVNRRSDRIRSTSLHRRPMTLVLFFLGLALFLHLYDKSSASAQGTGKTYYVSLSGGDANLGTSEQPFRTIQEAANVVNAGDTVIIGQGIYNESVTLSRSGSDGNYITFRGETNADGSAAVTIDAAGKPSGIENANNQPIHYIRIENVNVKNADGDCIDFVASPDNRGSYWHFINGKYESCGSSSSHHGMDIRHVEHLYIDRIYAYDNYTAGLQVYNSDYILITNVRAEYNNGSASGTATQYVDNADGILLQNSSHVVLSDVIARFNGEDGIDFGNVEGLNDPTGQDNRDMSFAHVRNCEVEGNSGEGLAVSETKDLTMNFSTHHISFARCVVYDNNLTNGWTYNGPSEVRYANVTLAVSGSGLLTQRGIFFHAASPEVQVTDVGIVNTISTFHTNRNFKDDSLANNLDSSGYNLANSGFIPGGNSISADPLFTNRAGKDFTLTSSSPAIDSGGPVTVITNSGGGNTLAVADSRFFHDGYGMTHGDTIAVRSNGVKQLATIINVPNDTTIVVDRSLSWNAGDWVTFDYAGSAPDRGYAEYGISDAVPTATSTPPSGPTAPAPTSNPTATPTNTSTPAPTPTLTPTATAAPAGDIVLLSSKSGGNAGGVSFTNEDILTHDTSTGAWSLYFDGSDVGLKRTDVDAFALLGDGNLLLSFDATVNIPGPGDVDDSDIVKFIPTSLGNNTAGSFEWYLDGSDVELTTDGEDIDALGLAPDGRLIISTSGSFSVNGASGNDEDLLAFTPATLGASTSGTWTLFFDGSDIGLANSSEDVWGTWIDSTNNDVYLTTQASFAVSDSSGDGSDIFICHPGSLGDNTSCTFGPGLYWDGSANGFAGEVIDAFTIVR